MTEQLEIRLKNRILGQLGIDNAGILAYLRHRVTERYPDQWVTADHARVIMRDEGSTFDTNNALGALFRHPEWTTDGVRVPSITKGSHGNPLLRWRTR